jgi:tetratricopeptide (TPR) repeat protein
MTQRFPQPSNEHEFEQFCLRFYRKLWKNDSLELYAKRGEKQHGVDIHDPTFCRPYRAVQCKQHEPHKTLRPEEIRNEVAKAECSSLPIEKYMIATTAQKSKHAQNEVVELNRRPNKKFAVELHFWEDICGHLNQFPPITAKFILEGRDPRPELYMLCMEDDELRSMVLRRLVVGTEKITVGAFREIEQLLLTRNFDAASYEIDKLGKEEQLRGCSMEDQYMLLRLRAKLALETGRFEVASELFLAAYEKQPDLEQAKHNRVLAYSLKKDSTTAFELVTEYLRSGFATPLMLCRFIESAPTDAALHEHMTLITPHLDSDEDINLALCHRWLLHSNTASAKEAADRAIRIAPESPHAHFAVALAHHNASLTGDWRKRRYNLDTALQQYNEAVTLAEAHNYRTLLPEILAKRAVVHAMLGNHAHLCADFRSAVAAAVRPSEYAINAVSYLVHCEDYQTARELLGFVDESSILGRFLHVITGFNSTEYETERRQYLRDMLHLAEETWERSVECRLHCVHWAIRLKDASLARSVISQHFQSHSPFQSHVALAYIAIASKDRPTAVDHADRAVKQDITGVHQQELRLLADVLFRLGDYDKALDVLDHIAIPGRLNDDTRLQIRCAELLECHGLLLRICRELRQTREQDEQLRRMEIRLLSRYAPEQGFALVDEFIQVSESPAYFVAFRNRLAVRLKKQGVLQLDKLRLPNAADLSPKESDLVTLPFVAAGMYEDALEFLFNQLRLWFDDEFAHRSYISFLLTYGEQTSFHLPAQRVQSGHAVLLESQSSEYSWVIIENSNPVPSRGEFAEHSVLALRMIGREVGDVVEMPGGLALPQRATIRAIQTKYARAFQDSLDHFRQRFPEAAFVQPLHVGSGDEFDPTPIAESLKQRREQLDTSFNFYRTSPCSLYLLACRIGYSEFDTITALTRHSTGVIRCCNSTPNEFRNAASAQAAGQVIVMDVSALTTLTLLDGWRFLDPKRCYLVSQTTMELIEQWVFAAESGRASEEGYVFVDENGRLRFVETTNEQRAARYALLNNIRDMIEQHCECRSSAAVAELPSKQRRLCEAVAGFHNTEAMSLAKDVGGVFWTDDLVLSSIAKSEFGVTAVWTQLALKCFLESGHLTHDDFNLVSAKLASWHYESTIWNADMVIKAGEHAQWDPQSWPFKQCIHLFATSPLTNSQKAQMALECLKILRQSSCNELRQSSCIQAILDALGDRNAVVLIYKQLPQAFPVDIRAEAFARIEIEYWLKRNLL